MILFVLELKFNRPTWIPAWTSSCMPSKVWDLKYLSIPKRQRLHCWDMVMDDSYILHFIIDVINFPCRD